MIVAMLCYLLVYAPETNLVEILWQPIRGVFGANTSNKAEHSIWKGLKNWARKLFLFSCSVLFEVSWAFWKMCLTLKHQISITCLLIPQPLSHYLHGENPYYCRNLWKVLVLLFIISEYLRRSNVYRRRPNPSIVGVGEATLPPSFKANGLTFRSTSLNKTILLPQLNFIEGSLRATLGWEKIKRIAAIKQALF